MRFIKLKLNNITSLRGEHIIDFGEALGHEELFAITGATGSGKSSLLTAISLALYGNTYKKTLNQWEYVTQDESEASIDLEFSSNGVVYRALWRCKKHIDKNGILRPKYTKELLANGEMTDQDIETIVGLNFEQFKKTIILNQGQFAEFLTATFTERKLILENLAGAELLSGLNKNLKEKIREMSRVQGELEARIEGGLPFSEDDLKAMREKVVELNKERPTLEHNVECFQKDENQLNELVKWIRDINRYKGEEQGALLELQTSNDHLQKSKDDYRVWQKEFDAFKTIRDRRRDELQKAIQFEKELDSKTILENTIAQKDLEREKVDKQWQSNLEKWTKREKEISAHIEDLKLDSDYLLLSEISRNAIDALMAEWNESLNQLNINLSKIENAKAAMDKTKVRGSELSAELVQLETKKSKLIVNPEEFNQLDQFKEEHSLLNRYIGPLDESIRNSDEISRKIKNKNNEKEEFQKQLILRKDKVEKDQLRLENLQLKKKQAELEQAISTIIDHHHEGDDCLICGNNWNEEKVKQLHQNKSHSAQDLNSMNQLEKEIQAEEIRIESLEEKVKSIKSEIQSTEIELKRYNDNLIKYCSELKINKNAFNKADLEKNLDLLGKKIRNIEDNASEAKLIEQALKQKNEERLKLRDEWSHQNDIHEECLKAKTNLELIIKRSYQDLKSRLPEIPSELSLARNYLKKQHEFRHQREKLEQEANDLKQRLQQGHIEAGERNLEKTKDATIRTTLLQEIQQLRQKLSPLIPEGSTSKALKAIEEQDDEKNKQKDHWQAKLKELEQKCETNRTKHGFISEQLKKARSELEKILSTINSRDSRQEYKNLSDFSRGFEKLKTLNQSHEIEAAFNEIQLWFSEFFMVEYKKSKESFKALETELIELKKSLDIDAKKRKELEKFKEELDIAIKKKRRWDELSSVLGQDEFRGFALGLVEERLVEQTNFELEHLCEGRYQITLLENKKQSQDFLVIDNWRGGGERKISTLSGGETFLVSLAMALSLAELARGQTEVDAFFIDEGFGTLDRDSIDDVLEVLSNVQSRGKQIGLISHVKALTDRIPVNLHLEKSNLGDSKIRIIYN